MKLIPIRYPAALLLVIAALFVFGQENTTQHYDLIGLQKADYLKQKVRLHAPFEKNHDLLQKFTYENMGEHEIIFSEDFEDGAPAWSFLDLWSESFWHVSTTAAYSGNSYWCALEELGGYDDNWVQTLTSPEIDLTGSVAPWLTFVHHFNIESFQGEYFDFDAYDAMAVRISTDGVNFSTISPDEGFPYNADNAVSFYTRFGSGHGGWTGNSFDWITSGFNLEPFAGQTIWIQFLFGSDFGYSSENDPGLTGWRVDDILITDGSTIIFDDDAGDTGTAQFIAGGPGGPNPWHLTNTASVSGTTSVGCFDIHSGTYPSGMFAALVSPTLLMDTLPLTVTKIAADFQIKGHLDNSLDAYSIHDFILAEARTFANGAWSYWQWVSLCYYIPVDFTGYNESNYFKFNLTGLMGADSIQCRIILSATPDGEVIAPASLFIDDFTVGVREGYDGAQFGSFYDLIMAEPWTQRQAVADSFMTTLAVCPLIEENSIVTFLYQGDVTSISIPGEINFWDVNADPMIRIPGTDLWFKQMVFEADARHEYKFHINGSTWINDPLNPDLTNYEYTNSQVSMPEYLPPPEMEYNPDIPHGIVEDTLITSEILGNSRSVRVYTPPNYDKMGEKAYPVVLFHDGQSFFLIGQINNTLDNLIAAERIREIIAVFVPPVQRDDEYAFDKTDLFEAFIVEELMPALESRYRFLDDPGSRAMAGFSFGGLISTQICYNRPDDFGLCAAMSPAYWPNNFEVYRDVVTGPQVPVSFYIDWGTYEFDIMLYAKYFTENISVLEYELTWNEWHEGHNYGSWRAHLDNMLEYFFPAVTEIAENERASPFSLKCAPNPFHTAATITFELKETIPVDVQVMDLMGELVCTWNLDVKTNGRQEIRWTGMDAGGRPLSSGIYIIRLTAGLVDESAKVIITR